jgi:hypothetical protein
VGDATCSTFPPSRGSDFYCTAVVVVVVVVVMKCKEIAFAFRLVIGAELREKDPALKITAPTHDNRSISLSFNYA